MKATTSYERINELAPELASALVQMMKAKLSHKSSEASVVEPQQWTWFYEWSQRIYPMTFDEMLSNKTPEPQPASVEEKVHDYFKKEDLFVTVVAQAGRLKSSVDFPKFGEEGFFIPQEMVEAYTPKALFSLDSSTVYPRKLVYCTDKEGSALYESIVWGGLENLKNGKKTVVVGVPEETHFYAYSVHDNVLVAQHSIAYGSGLNAQSFLIPQEVKLGRHKMKTLSPQEAASLLQAHDCFIEDADSVIALLLGELHMPGAPAIQQAKPSYSEIPKGVPTVHIKQKEGMDAEVRKKLKIR